MVEAKYLCFPICCIFIILWSCINIGFKNIPPLEWLIPVKTMCNLHCWIQLSPIFQKHGTQIFDLTWPLSDVIGGMKGNPEVTPQKKVRLPNVCVPILAKQ